MLQYGVTCLRLDSAGINEKHLSAVPVGIEIYSVSGNAGNVLDDGDTLTGYFIKESAFTHVRASDYSNYRFHTFTHLSVKIV